MILKNNEGFEIPIQIYDLFNILVKHEKNDYLGIYAQFQSWSAFCDEIDGEHNIKFWIGAVLINFCHHFIRSDNFIKENNIKNIIEKQLRRESGCAYDLYLITLMYVSTKYKTKIEELKNKKRV